MLAWNLGLVAATLVGGGVVGAPVIADNDCNGDSCTSGDGQASPNDLDRAGELVTGFSAVNVNGVTDLSFASSQEQASLDGEAIAEDWPVATAYAPPIIATEDTCMGSSTVGGQSMTFGVSVGVVWQDDNCRRIKNARQLAAMGYRRAAVQLLCVDDEVRAAMSAAGTPCPGDQREISAVAEPAPPASEPPAEPSDFSFLFDFDSATLKPESTAALERMLAAHPAVIRVEIEGHADAIGAEAYNLALSRRRARAVADWLMVRGVTASVVSVEAKGEAEPVAGNETAAGRALNRRVEVTLQ